MAVITEYDQQVLDNMRKYLVRRWDAGNAEALNSGELTHLIEITYPGGVAKFVADADDPKMISTDPRDYVAGYERNVLRRSSSDPEGYNTRLTDRERLALASVSEARRYITLGKLALAEVLLQMIEGELASD